MNYYTNDTRSTVEMYPKSKTLISQNKLESKNAKGVRDDR